MYKGEIYHSKIPITSLIVSRLPGHTSHTTANRHLPRLHELQGAGVRVIDGHVVIPERIQLILTLFADEVYPWMRG